MAVLDWLMGNCSLFGFDGQNWMWAAAGGMLAYIGALVFVRYRQAHHTARNSHIHPIL